uniref:ATP synthase subunit a n=1 Tax=Anser fabalis TaxID=132587 RepID=H6TFI7_ANSFA|nr:ATP synthase F0 subunit 6 [Anser fabalis]
MNLSFFDQFSSPNLFGIPLILLSLLFPALLFPSPNNRWINNRLSTIQTWLLHLITKQLMVPLNKNGHKWAMMFTSLMIMLLTINVASCYPYTFTPTTQLSMNMALEIVRWTITASEGNRKQPSTPLPHRSFWDSTSPLQAMETTNETTSLLIRRLALGVRLTANLTAGHLLIQLISTASIALMPTLPAVSILTMIILLLLTILEVAVAMIQAYVFVLLLSLYLQENI